MELLVPVDFSDCTNGLVDQASDLASKLGAALTLLHAVDLPAGLASAPLGGGDEPPSASELLERESQQLLAVYTGRARARGVAASGLTRRGLPGPVILNTAQEIGADMIVMGTHGRRGVARMLLGSIAEHVIRRAEIPVVTVRTLHRPECEARSCAVCDTDHTPLQQAIEAELDG